MGEQVEAKGEFDQAREAGGGQWSDDRRFGVQARTPGKRSRQVRRERLTAELERGPAQTENLVTIGPVHHHDQVTQPIAGGHQFERLVNELEARRRAGQQAGQFPKRAVDVLAPTGVARPRIPAEAWGTDSGAA